jgi:hypothetical protein
MHDGRFSTLAEVVDFYDRGGDFNAPNKSPLITPLNLTPLQKGQLVAFLSRPLVDPRVASATAPFDRPGLYTETDLVPAVVGTGVPGISGLAPAPVALEPALAGNPSFTVGMFGGFGGAEAVLVIDDAEPGVAGIPETGSFARQSIVLGGSGASDGFGSVTLAIPDDEAQLGRVLYGRWYVNEPSGVAASPSFRFRIFGPNGAGANPAGVPAATAAALRLHGSSPNPFAAGTSVMFELARTAPVRLAVYDVAGRLRRRLFESAAMAPGTRSIAWDGRDDGGNLVPGGVYFYRLETDRETQSTRVVRMP